MFNLKNRRYTGAKTKLLEKIDFVISKNIKKENLSFFDVFAGTGVVGEYFIKKNSFDNLLINDFLYSNFVIFKAFFESKDYNEQKLQEIARDFNKKDIIKENYYSLEFGERFFSTQDASKIGYIRKQLEILQKQNYINSSEFYILLASLLFSSDKVANTVGHYDAYCKNTKLENRFCFELISPLKLQNKNIKIEQMDANLLAKKLVQSDSCFDIAFLDPPYNSRQYSRFYHLLETLAIGNEPELFGVARKPKPKNLSAYCSKDAKNAFLELVENLSKFCKNIVVTYNNTYNSNSNSSKNKITLDEIRDILSSFGLLQNYEFDFKPFNSGKTDTTKGFKEHKEHIFILKGQK